MGPRALLLLVALLALGGCGVQAIAPATTSTPTPTPSPRFPTGPFTQEQQQAYMQGMVDHWPADYKLVLSSDVVALFTNVPNSPADFDSFAIIFHLPTASSAHLYTAGQGQTVCYGYTEEGRAALGAILSNAEVMAQIDARIPNGGRTGAHECHVWHNDS